MNMSSGVVNPFSEKFMVTWELYKQYRKETHNFKFMGVISEQMSIKKVVEVSGGDEERAIRIVEQTIASGKWSGFYPLKTTTYKEDGREKSTKERPANGDSLQDRVGDEFIKRFGDWQSPANGSNLKAV